MMTKVGKNLYQWHGTAHQHMTLAWLKQLAERLNLLKRYQDMKLYESQTQSGGIGELAFARSDLKKSPSLTPTSLNSSMCSPYPGGYASSPASSVTSTPSGKGS